jgi:hypothetical protein
MIKQSTFRLAKISPWQITVKDFLLQPSQSDRDTIQEDLIEYISLSRLIHSTPTLRLHEGELVIINGLPFLRAAQEATPPIDEIICRVDSDEAFTKFSLQEITATELLDTYPANKIYRSPTLLVFVGFLTDTNKKAVEKSILSFFKEMIDHPENGGNFQSISDFCWSEDSTKVIWFWEKCNEEGVYRHKFIKMLRQINSNIAPLKSWNGLIFNL